MHAPYRTAASPEPEQPDQVDEYEAVLRARSGRSPRLVAVVMCGVITMIGLASFAGRHSRSRARANESVEAHAALRLASAHHAVAEARRTAFAEQRTFAAAIHAAIDANHGPSSTPCDVMLSPPEDRFLTHRASFPLVVIGQGDRDIPSPSVAAVLRDIHRAEDHLRNGKTLDGLLYANGLAPAAARPRLVQDVVVVTSVVKHPTRTDPQTYEPGEIAGRAYLYDFAEHRVRCVGDVHAASSRQIAYSFVTGETAPASQDQGPSLSASLDVDLQRQLEQAIAHGGLSLAL